MATAARTLRADAQQVTCSPSRPQAIAYYYVSVNEGRWGQGMLGAQRTSLDSDELHAGAPQQPPLEATQQHGSG
jgi:hypothetical protein